MKKIVCCYVFFVCGIFSASVFAQTGLQANTVQDLDSGIQTLSSLVAAQMKKESAGTKSSIVVGMFSYQSQITNLGTMITQNLINELSVQAENQYQVMSGGGIAPSSPSRADYTITGEIVEIADIFRVYTRLVRTADSSIAYSWRTDFQKTVYLMNMLNVSGNISLPMDMYEFDSMDNPVEAVFGGGDIARNIHSENDEDWFIFTTPQDAVILFMVKGMNGFDSRMTMYDSIRNEIASNDDYADGYDAGILRSVKSGDTLYIKVTGYSDETGSYNFHMQENHIEDQAMEPNDSMEQAYLLEPSTGSVTGFFMSSDDADWYKIIVPLENKSLRIYTEGDMDTYFSLYDERGNVITENDDGGSDYNASISRSLSQGTYYVKVTELDGDSGIYYLFMNLRDAPQSDSYEPDNTMANASEIIINTPQVHTFTDDDDEDWVYFTVSQNTRYTITAVGDDPNLDTYIELYDEDGDLLDENDDGGESYDARLRINLEPGTYYILITTLDDFSEPESYTLSVRD